MIQLVCDVVHDKPWLARQPRGTVATYVEPKGDSGVDALSVAAGEGVNGGDCLAVTAATKQAGLPGFWVIRGRSTGRAVANLQTEEAYLWQEEQAVNRLSFCVRFDRGFRQRSSAERPHNFVVGTYHFDPAKIGKADVKESDNWHFYHQLLLRHDLAENAWIRVVINDIPQHQRSRTKGNPAANPTSPACYFPSLTRFYLDCTPYHSDPELPYPVRMFVDQVEFLRADPPGVSLTFAEQARTVAAGRTTQIPFQLKNTSPDEVTGTIVHRSHYSWTPAITNGISAKSMHKGSLTLRPYETQELFLEVTPRSAMKHGFSELNGAVFVPRSAERPFNASHSDDRVRLDPKLFGYSGPCDAAVSAGSVKLTIG